MPITIRQLKEAFARRTPDEDAKAWAELKAEREAERRERDRAVLGAMAFGGGEEGRTGRDEGRRDGDAGRGEGIRPLGEANLLGVDCGSRRGPSCPVPLDG